MSVAYCPTKEMVADYFTKPLQGESFRKLRAYIMNEPVKDGSTLDSSAEPQECVEEISNVGGSEPAGARAGSLEGSVIISHFLGPTFQQPARSKTEAEHLLPGPLPLSPPLSAASSNHGRR